MKILKLIPLLSALLLAACTAEENYTPPMRETTLANSRSEALSLLPEETRLKYEAWQSSLAKECSVTGAFGVGQSFESYSGIDLKLFFEKTGNSLFLAPQGWQAPENSSGEYSPPEFAIFGKPSLLTGKGSSATDLPIVRQGRAARTSLEIRFENGICNVYVGKYKIDSYVLPGQIPVVAHSSSSKRSLSTKIGPSDVQNKRGYLKFSGTPITLGGRLALHPDDQSDFMMGSEPNTPVQSSAKETTDFLFQRLGGIERNQISSFFPLVFSYTAEVKFSDRATEIPFTTSSNIYGPEREFRELREKKLHEIRTTWRFRPDSIKVEDPNLPGEFITNEAVDLKSWDFEVTHSLDGNLQEGGSVLVKSLVAKTNLPSLPATNVAECFVKRSSVAKNFANTDRDAKDIAVSWWDVAGGCGPQDNILSALLDSPAAMEEFRHYLRLSKPSRAFGYGNWDIQYIELVKLYLNGDPDKDIGKLDPNNNVPLIAKTKQNLSEIKNAMSGSSDLTRRYREGLNDFLNPAIFAALYNFDLNSLQIPRRIRESAERTTGLMEESYRNYIQNIAVHLVDPPKDPKEQPWRQLVLYVERMDAMSDLPDSTNAELEETLELAQGMGLEGWINNSLKQFALLRKDDINIERIRVWRANLQTLSDFNRNEDLRRGGQPYAPERYYEKMDFEARYLNLNWNALTVRYLTKFAEMAVHIPECSAFPDVVSRVWCANRDTMYASANGMLSPATRDRLWELGNELNRVLPRLGAGDSVRVQVAKAFFKPMFQTCPADNFRIKTKELMSLLVKYYKNPAEKALPDFSARLEAALATCQ